MNAIETGKLLGVCAAYDQRTTGDADTLAWTRALADLSYDDCEQAVLGHYAETDAFIRPATVRARVRAIRAARLAAAPLPAPPVEIADNPQQCLAWQRAVLRQIADGRTADARALGSGPRAIGGR